MFFFSAYWLLKKVPSEDFYVAKSSTDSNLRTLLVSFYSALNLSNKDV